MKRSDYVMTRRREIMISSIIIDYCNSLSPLTEFQQIVLACQKHDNSNQFNTVKSMSLVQKEISNTLPTWNMYFMIQAGILNRVKSEM